MLPLEAEGGWGENKPQTPRTIHTGVERHKARAENEEDAEERGL